ncbi:hypothetical protein [Mesorhizobium neociceri]|uniref:Serine protease n=1 Tax=Mesorhizobium neociceri TaxID=1307853 RepID=A0A838B8G4_9HYPH|nr:hypothetical protein [Mesorhizobium neociceri]MBA1142259.1 hypothetical protein [Mesorhizobium neociceri]
MPRIPDDTLDVAFYLYPSEAAAKAGQEAGGTGFVVMVPFERVDGLAVILVTNKHVIQQGHTFVRLNRKDGSAPDVFEIDPVEWYPHSGPHDVAVAIGVGNGKVHSFSKSVHYEQLLTRDMVREYDIGIGDDVFMIGRFIGHDGKTHNRPSVRFGNISVDVGNIYNSSSGHNEESYAVEVKSKPGYSGSCVLVYALKSSTSRRSEKKEFVLCLGINWGHILERRPVLDDTGKEVEPKRYVRVPSDMSGIVPAWRILELIDSAKVRNGLKMIEDKTILYEGERRSSVEPTVAEQDRPATDENPRHREGFTALLNVAARTPPQGD